MTFQRQHYAYPACTYTVFNQINWTAKNWKSTLWGKTKLKSSNLNTNWLSNGHWQLKKHIQAINWKHERAISISHFSCFMDSDGISWILIENQTGKPCNIQRKSHLNNQQKCNFQNATRNEHTHIKAINWNRTVGKLCVFSKVYNWFG